MECETFQKETNKKKLPPPPPPPPPPTLLPTLLPPPPPPPPHTNLYRSSAVLPGTSSTLSVSKGSTAFKRNLWSFLGFVTRSCGGRGVREGGRGNGGEMRYLKGGKKKKKKKKKNQIIK